MNQKLNSNKYIFVMGTTASGKSDWALRLAQKFDGVIVNCDSIQAYEKVDIGAAKPSLSERALVPHYLFDYVTPPNELTAGKFLRDFQECVKSIPNEKLVVVVGGTGFYFQAIEKGMYPVIVVPESVKEQVSQELATDLGAQELWQELQKQDPEYALKINKADHYRLGRAIELIRTQGRGVTEIQQEFAAKKASFSNPLLKLAPQWEKGELNSRISMRTKIMLQRGLVEEVRALLVEGLGSWAPLASVGYRETVQALQGDSLEEQNLFEAICVSTRQLAKKQRTWFQRDQDLNWYSGHQGFPDILKRVENFLNS